MWPLSWYFLQAYTFDKSGAKQKLVFNEQSEQNLEADTCSKAVTYAEKHEEVREISTTWICFSHCLDITLCSFWAVRYSGMYFKKFDV